MKNKYLLFLVIPIPLLLISFSTVIPGIKLGNDDPVKNHYQFTDDYKGAWHKVDSLQNLGLTRSALEIVESIYDVAKKDHNQPQLIKAVFFKLKYANYTEEDSHVKIINDIKAEIDSASFPANSILNSVLASIYWRYYQNNRWRFQQRTETINFDNENFQTWDLPVTN